MTDLSWPGTVSPQDDSLPRSKSLRATGPPMMYRDLFTIGHSNHALDHFLKLLSGHGVTALVDVRSNPYSRRNRQFNREALAKELQEAKVAYFFLGQELGARRAELSCYVNGRAHYGRIARLPLFQEGLRRIRRTLANHRIVLMCAERDPIECHRAILVCRHLRTEGIHIRHILGNGNLESHNDLEMRLLESLMSRQGLFNASGTPEEQIEKAYDLQGERIAYKRSSDARAPRGPVP